MVTWVGLATYPRPGLTQGLSAAAHQRRSPHGGRSEAGDLSSHTPLMLAHCNARGPRFVACLHCQQGTGVRIAQAEPREPEPCALMADTCAFVQLPDEHDADVA